jgi:hypothetical protein
MKRALTGEGMVWVLPFLYAAAWGGALYAVVYFGGDTPVSPSSAVEQGNIPFAWIIGGIGFIGAFVQISRH